MTLDLRLVPAALAAWVACFGGVLLPAPAALVAAGVLLLLAGCATWTLWRGARHRDRAGPTPQATATLALVVAALVLLSTAAHLHQRAGGLLADLVSAGAVVTVHGPVTGDPTPVATQPGRGGEQRVTVPVRADVVTGRGLTARARAPVLLLAPESWAGSELGARVRLTGRLVTAEPGQAVVALVVVHGEPQVQAPPPLHHRLANQMRAGLVDAVADSSSQARGLVSGIAVGDDSRLPPELEQAMRTVALTHITAVSGAHVAIVL